MKKNKSLKMAVLASCLLLQTVYTSSAWADNIEDGSGASAGRDQTHQYENKNDNLDNIAVGKDAFAGNGGTVTKIKVIDYRTEFVRDENGKKISKQVECGSHYVYTYIPGNNENNVAIGKNAQAGNGAGNSDNTAVGAGSVAGNGTNKIGATAFGAGAQATGNFSTTIGDSSQATGVNSLALGANSKATATNSIALGQGSDTGDRENTVSVGSTGIQRQITNVAAGTQDTDAVNVGQLTKSVNVVDDKVIAEVTNRKDADAGLQTNISNEASARAQQDARLDSRIDNLSSRVDKVGALAAAFSGLAPMPYDAAQPTQMSIGAGTYSGQQAIAIGIYHYTKNDVLLNAGIAFSGSETMGRIGVTWKIGGSKAAPVEATKSTTAVTGTTTNAGDITTRVKRILEERDTI